MTRPYGHKDGRLIGEPPKPRGIGIRQPADLRPGHSQEAIEARREREIEEMARKAEEEAERERNRLENQAISNRRNAKIGAARIAKIAEAEAAYEQSLAPEKERLMRQWLADHPGKHEGDFDADAWPLLKENLRERDKAAGAEELQRRYRREMRSSL